MSDQRPPDNKRPPVPWYERPSAITAGAAWEERVVPRVEDLREFYIKRGSIIPESTS